jgi:hypothetical protein
VIFNIRRNKFADRRHVAAAESGVEALDQLDICMAYEIFSVMKLV